MSGSNPISQPRPGRGVKCSETELRPHLGLSSERLKLDKETSVGSQEDLVRSYRKVNVNLSSCVYFRCLIQAPVQNL